MSELNKYSSRIEATIEEFYGTMDKSISEIQKIVTNGKSDIYVSKKSDLDLIDKISLKHGVNSDTIKMIMRGCKCRS